MINIRQPLLASLASITFGLLSGSGFSQTLYEQFPQKIRADESYVFYSHGLIVEGNNPTPVHKEFGIYDFPGIKQALFEIGGFNLIAHHREKNTGVETYVTQLVSWVTTLIDEGVKPENITLIGFSRGGQLTAAASSRLSEYGLNTVIMAICFNEDFTATPPLILGGRLLSIYEVSDGPGSCQKLANRSQLTSFDKIAINTGLKHGAFYAPHDVWLVPIQRWLQGDL